MTNFLFFIEEVRGDKTLSVIADTLVIEITNE